MAWARPPEAFRGGRRQAPFVQLLVQVAVSSTGATPSSGSASGRRCGTARARLPGRRSRRTGESAPGGPARAGDRARASAGRAEGLLEVAASHQQLHQPPQRRGQLALQGAGLADLPVVEGWAVPRRESLQEVAVEKPGGLFERRLDALAVRLRKRSTSISSSGPRVRAIRSRVASRCCPPIAVRKVESVRRRAPRACSLSWPGHRSSASASRG